MASRPSPIESCLAPTAAFQPRFVGRNSWNMSLPAMMILDYLQKHDLLSLRAVSSAMKAWVESDPRRFHARVFGTLYYHGRATTDWRQQEALETLATIAPYCQRMKIYLYDEDVIFPLEHLSLQGLSNSFWIHTFSMLSTTLKCLAISAPGINGWDWLMYGSIEKQVASIRVAMERKLSRGLDVLHLDPINAGALLHLRWRGATISSASSQAEMFWSNLAWLRIKVFNPLNHLVPSNRADFLKTLHDFLRSFGRSLRGIEFHWIGAQGPNPLLLGLITEVEGIYQAVPFKWSALAYARLYNSEGDKEADFNCIRQCYARRLKSLYLNNGPPSRPLSIDSLDSCSSAPRYSPTSMSPVEFYDKMDDDMELMMFHLEL